MTEHDVLVGFRLWLFTLADEPGQPVGRLPGNGRQSLDLLPAGSARSTAGDWKPSRRASGADRGCPTRSARILSRRIVAFSLGHPAYGPRRISAELAPEK